MRLTSTLTSWQQLACSGHIVCRLLELKRLNLELKKQNQDKDEELAHMRKALEETDSTGKLTVAYKKIRGLEEQNMEVRKSLCISNSQSKVLAWELLKLQKIHVWLLWCLSVKCRPTSSNSYKLILLHTGIWLSSTVSLIQGC